MSLSSSQCSIDAPSAITGSRDFVFVKRENSGIGLGLLHVPEAGQGEPSVVWTNMDPPSTLKKEMIAKMELVKKLPAEPLAQLEHLLKLGGEMGYHELCFGVAYTSSAIIWASSSGIVALSRTNGSIVANWDSFVGANRLWVDEAKCTITSGSDSFELNTKRGGAFFSDCHREKDQMLAYFNGVELIILIAPLSTGVPTLSQRIPFDASIHKVPNTKPGTIKATITTNDKTQITINGVVFL